MADKAAKYQAAIGIECHVQLKTKTKLFSGELNNQHDVEPNSAISPITLGLPGVLPVLNETAVKLAVRAGLALNGEITKVTTFDRKHYFYPDLPKGYQITQYQSPIIARGKVTFEEAGEEKTVRITRAHMEEDAGKSVHPAGKDYTLIDLNRAGSPLLEIVSEPDMRSAAEAKAFAQELYLLMKYADVSDGDLYHGNMRFDVNVSVAPRSSKKLGTRTETKNLNSFRSVERAVEHEIKRQIVLLEKGVQVEQETRGWDEAKQKTFAQRTKEFAHDYRYFPEPDIPPYVIPTELIEEQRQALTLLPGQVRAQLRRIGLDKSLVDAAVMSPRQAATLVRLARSHDAGHIKTVATLFMHTAKRLEGQHAKAETVLPKDEWLVEIARMVESGKLSSTAAKEVFSRMVFAPQDPHKIAEELDLVQVSDASELSAIVAEVIQSNSKAAEDVRGGEEKAVGFLIGQVMARTKGRANPQMVQAEVRRQLGV